MHTYGDFDVHSQRSRLSHILTKKQATYMYSESDTTCGKKPTFFLSYGVAFLLFIKSMRVQSFGTFGDRRWRQVTCQGHLTPNQHEQHEGPACRESCVGHKKTRSFRVLLIIG